MTYDELDKKIIEIKKKGLPYMVEQSKIAEVRGQYYDQESENQLREISVRFCKNIEALAKMHRSWPSVNHVEEFTGIKVPQGYNKFITHKPLLTNLRYVMVVSIYYNIPAEVLLFTDIEAHEKTIKEQYPFIFGKNTH